jgi:hypothetical protein
MSTWQLGVKHSITKRCTRGPRREVRLVAVANPRRVCAPPVALSVQVERGLGGRSSKGCAITRSWLKRSGGVRANRSVDRLVSPAVPAASVSPDTASAVSVSSGAASALSVSSGAASALSVSSGAAPAVSVSPGAAPAVPSPVLRGPLRGVQSRRAPLGLPQQHPADPGHGRQAQGRSGRAGQRGAVPDEDHGDQHAAEGRPAHHIARRVRRGRRCGVRSRGGVGRGLGSGHGLLPSTPVLPWRWLTRSTRVRPAGHCRRALSAPSPGEPCANRLYGAATIALRAPLMHAPGNAA